MTLGRHGVRPFCWTSQTLGVQEVPGSNSGGATKFLRDLAEIPESLGKAPTFHSSFDHEPDADFVLSNKRLCNATFCVFQKQPADLKVGPGDPPLRIAEGRGKSDSA